jgi:putative flippase GtrA
MQVSDADMSDPWSAELHRIARFVAVGVVNTVVGYGVYLAALWTSGSPATAVLAATVLGYSFNFFSTGRLVFQRNELTYLPTFILAAAGVYVFNVLLLKGLTLAGLSPELGQIICLPPVIILNYLALRRVFRR